MPLELDQKEQAKTMEITKIGEGREERNLLKRI